MGWLSEESRIAKFSEELVEKYNPAWTGGGVRRHTPVMPEWAKGMFEVVNAETIDVNVAFTRDGWHGRMKVCRGIGASSLPEETIAAFEREHLDYLNSRPERFDIMHFFTILNLRKR
jgi:hypothetical protein